MVQAGGGISADEKDRGHVPRELMAEFWPTAATDPAGHD
jgi:hypothetical protein